MLPKTAALYGLRYAMDPDVENQDYGFKTLAPPGDALIQEEFLTQTLSQNSSAQVAETDDTGDAHLATWLQMQYTNGAQGGDFVFLRVHAAYDSFSPFKMDSADSSNPPLLTLVFDGRGSSPPPPPPSLTLNTAAWLIDEYAVLNWTPVQGSGYLYTVWYSTNLLHGFHPLTNDLPDTVQGVTNLIRGPSGFYRLTVRSPF